MPTYPNDVRQLPAYQNYGSQNDFMIEPGVCILPLAEDSPVLLANGSNAAEVAAYSPVVIARLHAPYRMRNYKYRADKQNNPPPCPEFGDSGKFVFIGGSISLGNTLNPSYSNFDWQVATEYNYIENCIIRPQDGLVLGTPPFSQLTSSINAQNYPNQAPSPPIGAIAYAGLDAITGYWQGVAISGNGQLNGNLNTIWGYNVSSFFPGQLFYSDLINGGPTLLTTTSLST